MKTVIHMLAFSVEGGGYAVPLSDIEHVTGAVEITHLSNAPGVVAGVVNLHGVVIPVFDLRCCFGLPTRGLSVDDQFIIVRRAGRLAALLVDHVDRVIACEAEAVIARRDVSANCGEGSGVVRLADGLVVICDLDQFLDERSGRELDMAMDAGALAEARGGP